MDRSFLYLELDDLGIFAAVSGDGASRDREEFRIAYQDLPASEEEKPAFDAAMDLAAARLDLSSCSQALLCVTPLWISFRSVDLPFSSPKKIRQVLEFELESLLPAGDELYVSDFLKPGGKRGKGNAPVLTASIVESRISQYVEKLQSMGIQARLITPRGYAEAVVYQGIHREKQNLVFVTAADTWVSLTLFLDGQPLGVRAFPSAGMDARAIALKVRQAVIGFNQRTGNRRFLEILVCQAPGQGRDLVGELEKVLDPQGIGSTETGPGELLKTLLPRKKEKTLFNFCQGKYGASSLFKKHLGAIIATAVLLTGVFVLFLTGVAMENAGLTAQIAAIDARALSIFTQTFPDTKRIQDPYLQMKANVREIAKRAGSDGKTAVKDGNFKLVQILSELSNRIDGSIDTEISRFLFSSSRIVLSGSTDNFNNVDKIKGRIESSDLFKTVEISSAAADKKGNRVNFKFIIEM